MQISPASMTPHGEPSTCPMTGALKTCNQQPATVPRLRAQPCRKRPTPQVAVAVAVASALTSWNRSHRPAGRHGHRLHARRHRLVPQAFRARQPDARQAGRHRVRRRLYEFRCVAQWPTSRQPPLRLHRLRLRSHGLPEPARPGQCSRRARKQFGQKQPLVFRFGHLPARSCSVSPTRCASANGASA